MHSSNPPAPTSAMTEAAASRHRLSLWSAHPPPHTSSTTASFNYRRQPPLPVAARRVEVHEGWWERAGAREVR
ncbi:hypothetical protein GCM10010211_74160 [Streptomyces albospinus]|uniref:Uncharacterized protein n=1 Tax=Streptomyces albospinus TaxID=285515 RepID=A0ABQ2VPX8_9ACTN|nr:hypothetical protein GCM10010211_74160 [Streptomyces albospinus]